MGATGSRSVPLNLPTGALLLPGAFQAAHRDSPSLQAE